MAYKQANVPLAQPGHTLMVKPAPRVQVLVQHVRMAPRAKFAKMGMVYKEPCVIPVPMELILMVKPVKLVLLLVRLAQVPLSVSLARMDSVFKAINALPVLPVSI